LNSLGNDPDMDNSNHNKLLLEGMQLPEKYKAKFDVSNFAFYFSGSTLYPFAQNIKFCFVFFR
jgi:hypothetical protein